MEWCCLFLDLLAVPEIFQIIQELYSSNLRPLNVHELQIGKSIFDDSIQWELVRINHSNLICRRMHIAYVGFHTIHYDECISEGVFIHELVHVWQYEKYGSAYIVRALHAQTTLEGYDYGGAHTLTYKRSLKDYNFEQMAEIIKHAYELECRSELYNNFVKQLQE